MSRLSKYVKKINKNKFWVKSKYNSRIFAIKLVKKMNKSVGKSKNHVVIIKTIKIVLKVLENKGKSKYAN